MVLNMNSLVSILIPLYNSEKYILETLESSINQTYKNIEIIIVDDESTDNSLEIVSNYTKNHTNINIKIYTQKNSGAQKARNLAFEKSSGKYIQYLDADDILSNNKIEEQMKLITKFGDENSYSCKFLRFTDNINNSVYKNNKIDKTFDTAIDWLISSWSNGGMGQTSIWLTPRTIIEKAGDWNEDLAKNQDGEFFSRVILNSKKVIYSEKSIVYYRFTGNSSISSQMTEKAAKATLLSYNLYQKNTKKLNNKQINKAIAYCYLSFINHYYPNYLSLIKQAEDSIYKLGFNYSTLYLDNNIGKLSRIIGFKNAIIIRHFIKKIKGSK